MRIPAVIDEVDVDWLNAATGWAAASVEAEEIGAGVGISSAVYRLALHGDAPSNCILKLTALDETAVFTSTVLHMYEREVRFFEKFAADAPLRIPAGYGGAVSGDLSSMFLLMEDLGAMRVIDQNEGMALVDAEASVDSLARWHSHYWRNAGPLVDAGAGLALTDPLHSAVLPAVFDEGWAIAQAELAVHPAIADVAPRWSASLDTLLARIDGDITTFVHGDYRADNILFDGDDPVLLDFQLGGRATGAYDLAYFVTQSLDAGLAGDVERSLFDRWRAGLIAGGVAEADTSGLWDEYRWAALFCLVYPIATVRQIDFGDPRQVALIDNMSSRCARAIEELDLAALI